MKNQNVLITGFNDQGELTGRAHVLKDFSFAVYEDNFLRSGYVTIVDQNGAGIACSEGTDGRPVNSTEARSF